MNRAELLQKIEAVEPALAAKFTIPILSHLWFTGRHVMAYNDGIAISAALATDFKAAVPPLLTKLLRASLATEVDMALKGRGELSVKASKAKISIPTLPPDDFTGIFKMPEVKQADTSKIMFEGNDEQLKEFFDAMEFAIKCVASDASRPEQLGVTFAPVAKSNKISVFSTNEKAMFATQIKTKNPLAKRLTLSEEFVKQVLTLRKLADSFVLYIYDGYALFKAGSYSLFGKLIFAEQPLDFDTVLKTNFPDMGKKDNLAPVLSKMALILERSTIVVGNNDVEATVKDGKLLFKSTLGDNVVSDEMEFKNQPSKQIKFSPAIAKLAVDAKMDRMRITERCVIFTKGDWVFFVVATT